MTTVVEANNRTIAELPSTLVAAGARVPVSIGGRTYQAPIELFVETAALNKVFSPFDLEYGAIVGVDATIAVNLMTEAMRLTFDGEYFSAVATGYGKRLIVSSSLNFTTFDAPGGAFRDFQIDAAFPGGGIAMDLTDSQFFLIENFILRGSPISPPDHGMVLQRGKTPSSTDGHYPNAPRNRVSYGNIEGTFNTSCATNLCSESTTFSFIQMTNNSRVAGASCLVVEGRRVVDSDSDFVDSQDLTDSNIGQRYHECTFRRDMSTGWNITGISKANPCVVSYTVGTGVPPVNGEVIVINTSAATGMTELDDGIFTIANASGTTIELLGVDSTLYTTYISGGSIYYQASGAPVTAYSKSHRLLLDSCYIVTYGTDAIQLISNGENGPFKRAYFDVHVEGVGIKSAIYFDTSAGDGNWQNLYFHEHNSHISGSLFRKSADGNTVSLDGMTVTVETARVELGLAALFEDPSKFFIYRGDFYLADKDYWPGQAAFGHFDGRVFFKDTNETLYFGTFAAISHGAIATIEDYGAHEDNTDNAPYIQDALDAVPEVIVPERTFLSSEIIMPSNRTLRGVNANSILKELGSMGEEDWFISNTNIDETSSARLDANIWIKNLTIDGSLRTWTPWLSKLDKTPITDPEADYVPITGALGSGLTPTVFGAVTIVSGAITAIAVTTPGANFGGHPTFPYVAATVGLEIIGDGEDCSAHGVIVAGNLTSVTIDDGGRNYTVVTNIRERGGYADISLLADPSVDRRNPDYNKLGYAIIMRKVDGGGVSGITLIDHGNAGIVDLGCKGFQITENKLIRVGKVDQDAYCIWSRSYKTPNSGHVAYAPSDGVYIARNTGTDLRRMFVNFSPAQGGICEENDLNGGQEAGIRVSEWLAYNGGRGIIRNNKIRNVIGNDIEGNGISVNDGAKHLEIDGNTIQGCEGLALEIKGVKHLHVHHNRIKDIGVNVPYPYGPFSEKYDFGQGTEAQAGMPRPYTKIRVIDIGTQFGTGNDNVKIEDNTILEARDADSHPSTIIKCTKSGGIHLSKNTVVRRNFVDVDNGTMDFIDRSDTLVFLTEHDLAVYENVPYDLIGSGAGLGRKPIYIPASEMRTRVTQGAAAYTAELATNKVNVSGWSYVDDAVITRHTQFEMRIPANWDGSDLVAQFDWLAPAGAVNDGVVWSIQAAIRNDGDTIDQAYGTGVVIQDLLAAVNTLQRTAESPEFTPSGTLTPGGRGFFQIDRKVLNVDDFLAGNAVLLGCVLWFNINKPTEI